MGNRSDFKGCTAIRPLSYKTDGPLAGFAALTGALLLALVLLTPRIALAFETFTIRDIRVEGVQRIDPGTVFSYLPVRVGQVMNDERASESIRALFATGFFKDVRLEVQNDVLVVFVSERPAIASLVVTGAREFSDEVIKKTFADIGLRESLIFDRSVLERAEQELKRQYLSRAKYAVQVTTTVTPLERNRVGLNIKVDEGESARIVAIRFVGNEKFTDAQLLDQIRLSTPTWLTWYTKTDQYAREKLAGDLETLRSFYLDQGYLEFSIDSTQVSITPDKEDVHVTIAVSEGEQYTVAGLDFGGQLLGRENEFAQLLPLRTGDVFSGAKLTSGQNRITQRLGELGYAFANVSVQQSLDRAKREVRFTILVDPGRRVYVRRINISGNGQTRDAVIRRELRQFESAWYDAEKIRLSRERLGRLGYFTDVRIDTEPVPGVSDQIDLAVKVTENASGSLLFGVGTSSTETLILSAAINQQNFLGTGKALDVEVNTSNVNRTISVSYTDPYFTDDGISRSFKAYSRVFNASELDLGDYRWRSNALSLNFAIPYTELDRVSFGLAAENNTLSLGERPPQRYVDFVNGVFDPVTGVQTQEGVGRSSSALLGQFGWTRDSRDNFFTPNRGRLQRGALEFTMPVGELRYYKATYNHQYYYPLNKDYTLAFNADLGYARAFSGSQYPPFKNFYAGGIGSVRGYRPSSLGPGRDPVDNIALGGQTKIVGSIEFILPLAGSGNDRSFRWFLFLDGGNVFPEGKIDTSEFRYSGGIGLTWLSPIGPMKFSLGYPLNGKPQDQVQRVQFQIGTGF
ncbi:MAG: outer membrane protein assembly factor BamA [Burkholderiaceae bacterium]